MHLSNSLEILESRIAPAVLLVTSSADSPSATAGDGTLRGEILVADAAHGTTDTIEFAHGVTSITLTGGALDITDAVHILGPGASKLTINGNAESGIFAVTGHAAGTVFRGMTLENGNATDGGAISTTVSIAVKDSVLSGNTAIYGGAIAVSAPPPPAPTGPSHLPHASLLLENTTIQGNTATDGGGGVYMSGFTGSAAVINSHIIDNTGGQGGGGGSFNGLTNFVLLNSTVTGNTASGSNGNGFYSGGGLAVSAHNTLISGSYIGANHAEYGGGLFVHSVGKGASVIITGSSISGNSAVNPSNNNNTYGAIGGLVVESSTGALPTLITSSRFLSNTADGPVGGIYLEGGDTLFSQDFISGNTASDAAGGIFAQGNMTLSHTIVDGNSVTGTTGDFPLAGGGGICIVNGDTNIIGGHILNNSVTVSGGQGGGILDASSTGHLSISGSFIADNSASAQGGGIAITQTTNFGATGAKTALASATGSAPAAASHIAIVATRISGNTAGGQGGGLYASGATGVNLQQTIFEGNTSTNGTGGVTLNTTGPAHLTDATFLANVGATDGGLDIQAIGSSYTLGITGGEFKHNQGGDTGGIAIASGIKALVQDILVTGNVSTGDVFGAGGFSVATTQNLTATAPTAAPHVHYPVTLLDSTITGNINVGNPTKANTYGDFNT